MPPVNDNFADATLLSSSPTGAYLLGDNTDSTAEPGDPAAAYWGSDSTVWYKINPSGSSRTLSIGTFPPVSGTEINDSVIILWSGTTLGGLTLVSYNDDSGPGYYSLLTLQNLTAGETYYISVLGYNNGYQGGFYLSYAYDGNSLPDVPTPPSPPNATFAGAISLNLSGSVSITGYNVGTNEAWFKWIPPINTNGGKFVLNNKSGFNSQYFSAGFDEANLKSITDPATTGGYGPSIYLNIIPTSSTISFDYVFTPFPAYIAGTQPARSELKSPSASVTHYPYGAKAIRIADFAVGSSTVVSDATSPTGNYVRANQTITVTDAELAAGYYGSASASKASDSIVVDLNDLGLETGWWHYIFLLVKTVGKTPNIPIARHYERVRTRGASELLFTTDTLQSIYGAGYWDSSGDSLPNDIYSNTWRLIGVDSVTYTALATDILRIRLMQWNTSAVDIRVAQMITIPYVTINNNNNAPWNSTDYLWDYLQNNPYDRPLTFDRDFGSISGQYALRGLDYQNSISPTYTSSNDYNYYAAGNETGMFVGWGPEVGKATVIANDNFDTSTIEWTGTYRHFINTFSNTWAYDDYLQSIVYPYELGTNTLGSSPEGYCWGIRCSTGGWANIWDNDGAWVPSATDWGQKQIGYAYYRINGGQLIFQLGGGNNNVRSMSAYFAGGVNVSPNSHASPPLVSDLNDSIIETTVSWTGTVQEDGVGGNGQQDHAIIGWTNRSDYGYLLGQSGVLGIWVAFHQNTSGAVDIRIEQQDKFPALYDAITYIIDSAVFESGSYGGDKINVKFRKRGYSVDAKIWYAADSEPGSWTLSGYVQGWQVKSTAPFDYKFLDYPYVPDADYWVSKSGYHNDFTKYPLLATRANVGHPYNGSPQTDAYTVKWDNFKLSYDPDGTAVDTHLMFKNDALTETWMSSVTLPPTRQAITYAGSRVWGVDDLGNGFTTISYVDTGGATLSGVTGWFSLYRRLRVVAGSIISGIASMSWKQGD